MPRVPIFLIIALLLVMAFTLAQWLSVPPTASPEIPEEVPSHLVKSIDIDLDQCKQMETWTLAIIAGLTAMVLSNDVRVRITTKGQLAAYLLAGLACFASIVAAIYYQSRVAESLSQRYYQREMTMLILPRQAQYYGFMLGTIAFTTLLLMTVRVGGPDVTPNQEKPC